MKRTPLLLSILALSAGCRETPSSGTTSASAKPSAAPSVATAEPSASANSSAAPSAPSAEPSASATAFPTTGPTKTWSFDADAADKAPAGFELFKSTGKAGKWVIKAEPGAPSGANVLAQLDADKTAARYVLAIAGEASLRDVRATVRCKPISGKVDQACGLVFRFLNEKSYYVVSASGVDKDVTLYSVKDGKRTKITGWTGAAFGDAWHELRADARWEAIQIYWDGTRVFEATDKTLSEAGRVGVWTRADSVTHFDELSATPL